jgi:hypothetical protein
MRTGITASVTCEVSSVLVFRLKLVANHQPRNYIVVEKVSRAILLTLRQSHSITKDEIPWKVEKEKEEERTGRTDIMIDVLRP